MSLVYSDVPSERFSSPVQEQIQGVYSEKKETIDQDAAQRMEEYRLLADKIQKEEHENRELRKKHAIDFCSFTQFLRERKEEEDYYRHRTKEQGDKCPEIKKQYEAYMNLLVIDADILNLLISASDDRDICQNLSNVKITMCLNQLDREIKGLAQDALKDEEAALKEAKALQRLLLRLKYCNSLVEADISDKSRVDVN